MKKVMLLVMIACMLFGCGIAGKTYPKSSQSVGRSVKVTVQGARVSNITFNNGINQSQENGVPTPWNKEFTTDSLLPVVVVAQDYAGAADTVITCIIFVNGKANVTNKSTGAYSVVTCTEDI